MLRSVSHAAARSLPEPPSQRSGPGPPLRTSSPPAAEELVVPVLAPAELVVVVGAEDLIVVAAAVHELRRDVRRLRAQDVVVGEAENRVGAAADDDVVVEAAVEDVDAVVDDLARLSTEALDLVVALTAENLVVVRARG